MSNSEPYQHAMEMTQNSAEVVIQIGDQIEKNGMAQGNISYEDGTSEAELKIPVKGSKGEATVFVKAYKDGEEWIYEELYVLLKDSQQEINLLHKSLDDF